MPYILETKNQLVKPEDLLLTGRFLDWLTSDDSVQRAADRNTS